MKRFKKKKKDNRFLKGRSKNAGLQVAISCAEEEDAAKKGK